MRYSDGDLMKQLIFQFPRKVFRIIKLLCFLLVFSVMFTFYGSLVCQKDKLRQTCLLSARKFTMMHIHSRAPVPKTQKPCSCLELWHMTT